MTNTVQSQTAEIGIQLRNVIDMVVLSRASSDDDDVITSLREPAFAFIESSLKSKRLAERDQRQRLRLKLALHLAPPSAISYDMQNPTPRWQLIEQHLATALGRSSTDLTQLV